MSSVSRRVSMAEVSGGGVQGRQRIGGLPDAVKVALNSKEMTVEAGRSERRSGGPW